MSTCKITAILFTLGFITLSVCASLGLGVGEGSGFAVMSLFSFCGVLCSFFGLDE